MSTPLRAARSFQSLTAQASRPPARQLHMTGAYSQPSSTAFQQRMAEVERKPKPTPKPAKDSRPFNTQRALQSRNDSSPIDFVYFPQADPPDALGQNLPQTPLIPLLPDVSAPARAEHPMLTGTDAVHHLQVATNDPDGIEEGRVTVLSETDGGQAADAGGVVGLVGEQVEQSSSELRRIWDEFVEDLLGPKSKVA